MEQNSETARVQGIDVHAVNEDELVRIFVEWAQAKAPRRAYYVNVFAMNLAVGNSTFRDALNRADLVFCDGYGVWLASRLLGTSLPSRMTPPDWIDRFLQELSSKGKSVFLLGDEPGVAEKCASMMQSRHQLPQPPAFHHGFFQFNGAENDEIVQMIRDSGASVLLVGMGMPRQELWIEENLEHLGVSLAIPVGALFRWYTHEDKRAPKWMTDHGMEWLARLIRHPVRHFRRYVIGNPKFFVRILKQRFWPISTR